MGRRDDEYTPYEDRELPWERGRGQRAPQRARADELPRRSRERRKGCGCGTGCGCLLALVLLFILAGAVLRQSGARMGTWAMKAMVEGAIDGKITVNERRVTVHPAWREPWRATTAAYIDAFRAGRVGREHFTTSLGRTTTLVFQGGGGVDVVGLRKLCERMRSALPPDAVRLLPPLPERQARTRAPTRPREPTRAGTRNLAPPQPKVIDALAALGPQERRRQYEVRGALQRRLSGLVGPSGARRILQDSSVVFDFTLGVKPYPGLMDEWTVVQPPGGAVELGMHETLGFAAAPSLFIAATPAAKDQYAGVKFRSRARTLDFWYRFDGPAEDGSALLVFVNGQPAHRDAWPASRPGALGGDDWRHAHLGDLGGPQAPALIEIRGAVSGVSQSAFLYIDDLVFTP